MTNADKRIEALLERAGCPVMVVTNCKEGPEWLLKSNRDSHIWKLIDERYGGTPAPFIQELVDTIDRLEGALENVLNERDAALADLKAVDVDCIACARNNEYVESCLANECNCLHCVAACACRECTIDKNNYEWRGVPDKEESNAAPWEV